MVEVKAVLISQRTHGEGKTKNVSKSPPLTSQDEVGGLVVGSEDKLSVTAIFN